MKDRRTIGRAYSESRRRFGHIATDRLPRRVRELLEVDNSLRWRWERFRGSLSDTSERGVDQDLAMRLARYGCEREEIASALYLSPHFHTGQWAVEDFMEIAEAAYLAEIDRQKRESLSPQSRAGARAA